MYNKSLACLTAASSSTVLYAVLNGYRGLPESSIAAAALPAHTILCSNHVTQPYTASFPDKMKELEDFEKDFVSVPTLGDYFISFIE